jgi:hypothetical protein
MQETKAALIVANWKYEDADLRQLVAPANDAEALAGVLRNPNICGFEVTTLLNRPSREACEQIERFFLDRKRDDLLLLYFSCHGIKDDDGLLYFAAPDTRLIEHSRPLRSTALSADFVRSVMRASNSRRQVLMLDCCYSGAFAGAMLSKGDKSAGVRDQFEQGRGMVVMTASDALQYSFEGDSVAGEPVNSIFTRVLVKGIETGDADRDRDGTISLDELYDYAYEHVLRENANQRPKKWDLGVEGRIIVAQTPVNRPAELAPELLAAIVSPFSRVRVGAIGELVDLLNGGHKGLALAAREALEKLASDDSRQVSAAAEAALGRGGWQRLAGDPPAPEPVASEPHLPPSIPQSKPPTPPAAAQTEPVAAAPREPRPRPVPSEAEKLSPPRKSFLEVLLRAVRWYLYKSYGRFPVIGKLLFPNGPPPGAEPEKKDSALGKSAAPFREVARPAPQPDATQAAELRPAPLYHKPKRSSRWLYIPAVMLVTLGIAIYSSLRHSTEPGQSSGQQQGGEQQGKAPAVVSPVALPRPSFEYYAAVPQAADTRVRLTQVSSKTNQIIDEEEWFKGNDLELPTLTVPNSFKQEAGNIPAQIPTKQGEDILVKAIRDGNDLLCLYAHNFAGGRYLTSFDLKTGKVNFAFDFHEYMHPPKYLESDREFVEETVRWAQVKDNVLYVSVGHSTYAKSSFGLNAYLNAIDVSSGRLLWRSQPLVSNSANFLLYKDAIVTGYGFSQEKHFLYVVNQKDGRIVQTIPVQKSPEYILNKGDDIFVRTYDTDLVFKAGDQLASSPYTKAD